MGRIDVPDAMRSLQRREPILVRNPAATRPWQHVIEPLAGYLRLAESLALDPHPPCESFNFGPSLASNRPVRELVTTIFKHWPGEWIDKSDSSAPHEANFLHLQIDKAYHRLGWEPIWDFATTLENTVNWYLSHQAGSSALECCLFDLNNYNEFISSKL